MAALSFGPLGQGTPPFSAGEPPTVDQLRMPRLPGGDPLGGQILPAEAPRLNTTISLPMLANIHRLEETLSYSFHQPSLLVRALTHSSAANERRPTHARDNEQLEFLGDSIIGFCISDLLFRKYTGLSEGELSKVRAHLVSSANLSKLARHRQLDLGDFLVLGKGEEKTGGRKKLALLADALEAVVAAIYLDGGLSAAQSFVIKILEPDLAAIGSGQFLLKDFKSQLQERLQALRLQPAQYLIVKETGPDHRKYFSVELRINGQKITEGHGATKKIAEQEAARLALERFLRDQG
jgi:ribonuclease-3